MNRYTVTRPRKLVLAISYFYMNILSYRKVGPPVHFLQNIFLFLSQAAILYK